MHILVDITERIQTVESRANTRKWKEAKSEEWGRDREREIEREIEIEIEIDR